MKTLISNILKNYKFVIPILIIILLGVTFKLSSRQKEKSTIMAETNLNKTKLPESTSMSNVTLYVKDLQKVTDFYKNKVGLNVLNENESTVVYGNTTKILTLVQKTDLLPPNRTAAGLYHTAILFEDRSSLAKSIQNIFEKAPEAFEGSGDHSVSQAFYFHDPEGNGLELYFDRPRNEWQWKDGKIVMGTHYIDPQAFIKENLQNKSMLDNTKVGHVHLKVGDIQKAKEFYVDTLGFEITAEMPTALFVSAGDYHHHLGMNTWESLGSPKRSETLGLGSFEIKVGSKKELEIVVKRLEGKNVEFTFEGNQIVLNDPWNNKIIVSKS